MFEVVFGKPAVSPRPAPQPRRDDSLDCEICGARMIERSCKITCQNCGFTRDCSDP